HEPRRLPLGAGGVSPRLEVRERLPGAGRAPPQVPGRAGHGLGAAAPLRADDDRGEGALRLGLVPPPATAGGAGGGVPRAAGQAGGDGAVALRERARVARREGLTSVQPQRRENQASPSTASPDLDEVLIARKSKRPFRALEVRSYVRLQRPAHRRVRNREEIEHELGNGIRRCEIRRLDLRGNGVDQYLIRPAAPLLK